MLNTKLKESLAESKQISGNKWRAKLIAADAWGSSAYYTSEVLERDGSRVFHAGLQMFQNHLTESERWDRPEGSVENLVGKLESDAEFEANGPEGPGLYGDVEFYPSYVSRIAEIGKDVGLSVNAQGLTEEGERDGRYGPILVALLSADSVDVVTRAGAGGKLTSIRESDHGLAGTPIEPKENQSMTDVTKEDFAALSAQVVALPGLFVTALKDAGFGQAPVAPVVDGTVAPEATTSTDTTAVSDTTTAPVAVDHAAIVEAMRSNNLPAVTAPGIVSDVQGGATIEDAVKRQVALKEAFATAPAEHGTVHLQESAKSGLARALEILGK